MNLKDNLRKFYRQQRVELCAKIDKHKLDEKLASQILSVLPSQSPKYWGSYSAFKSEANPSRATTKGLNWVYPVISGEILKFYSVTSDQVWTPNDYGILEPQINGSKEIPLREIAGILIPGLAFDKKGYRLGSGKGFYDKTLVEFIGLKIGVCYSSQLAAEDLPQESHDVPVDLIVTEEEVLSIKEGIEL